MMTELDLFGQKIDAKEKQSTKSGIDFSKVIGQEKVKTLFNRIIQRKSVSKAYLFYGPEGCGKDGMAIELAKTLNCRSKDVNPCHSCDNCRQIEQLFHPDLKFVFAAPVKLKEEEYVKHIQKKSQNYYYNSAYTATAGILIDQIRDLKKTAGLRSYKANYRVFILSQADRMTLEAANSLLKLLEEPPERLILILTTSRIDQLLPTIVSRCQMIQFAPLKKEDIYSRLIEDGVDSHQAKVIARLSMGNFWKALSLLQEDHQQLRDQAWQLLMASQDQDVLNRIKLVTDISSGNDRGGIKELLLLAMLWLRDVQALRSNGDLTEGDEFLYNADQFEKLQKLNAAFETINLEKTIIETENSIDLVDKNVYINLLLINYLNHLEVKL